MLPVIIDISTALGPQHVCSRPCTSGPPMLWSAFLNIFKVFLRYLGKTGMAILSGQDPRINILMDSCPHFSLLGASLIFSPYTPCGINQMPQRAPGLLSMGSFWGPCPDPNSRRVAWQAIATSIAQSVFVETSWDWTTIQGQTHWFW